MPVRDEEIETYIKIARHDDGDRWMHIIRRLALEVFEELLAARRELHELRNRVAELSKS